MEAATSHSTEPFMSVEDSLLGTYSKHKRSELNESETLLNSETQQEILNKESLDEPALESPESPAEENEREEDEWVDILGSGQLKKKVLQRAENSYKPQRSNIVTINIEGRLPDGTVVDKQNDLVLQLGDAEHIQGVDLALTLMDVGEVALLEIGPRFAYGTLGREPDVPPNTTITYTVELLSAEEEPEIETLPATKRKEIGCRKRERGNYWYSRHEHTLAIQCYRRALNFLDDVDGETTSLSQSSEEKNEKDMEELREILEERLKVYNNLAAAQMKIKAFDTALMSVDSVLRCQPDNVKALYRKGKIMSEKGLNSEAVTALRQASRLEPDNRTIKQELLQMLSLHREDTKHEKNLYKKMLGQDKQPEDSTPKSNKDNSKSIVSTQFQFPWTVLIGTLAALVAGVVAYRFKFI